MKNIKGFFSNTLLKTGAALFFWTGFIAFLYLSGMYNYLLFHTGVELYTIIVAFIVFIIVINTYEISQNNFLTFLGIAYGFIGILDAMHTFSYKGIGMIGDGSANISTQFWIAARYLQGFSLVAAFLHTKKKINVKLLIGLYAAITIVIFASISYFKMFPDCFIDGSGLTSFKIISEYIIAVIFIIGMILLYRYRLNLRFYVYKSMMLSLFTIVLTELVLTAYTNVFDNIIIVGHIIRFASYYFFYSAVIVTTLKNPIANIFFELDNIKEELAQKNEEIIHTNEQLKQDLHDMQMIEKLLRKSKAWSRAIFEGSSIGIVLLNVYGVIIEANPAFERILGYDSEELRNLGMQNITPPNENEEDTKLFSELINGKIDSYEIEKKYVRKDGAVIWANLKMSYIQNTGEDFQFIIAMVEDITQKKLDEQKQHKLLKELEITNQELDGFAYIVSHDLKAPLRGIGSLASWLVKDYESKLDTEGKELLALITNRVERMKNFIDGILQYSRVSRITEPMTEINLNKIVNEVIEFIVLPDNISIVFENDMPKITGHKLYMEQVFQNLISNAVKFMDKEKGVIRIGCIDDGEYWRINVSDNGSGIEKRYFEKIFQIFQTLQPRDKFESTGIGLSIVKKIVENCGGRIWVESELGKGSTFYFTLPKSYE